MRSWEIEPVKWATVLLGILIALSSVQMFFDWLPDRVQAGILLAIAILTAVLGKTVRDRVTPLARPRDEDGRPLIRATAPRL